MAIIIDVIIVNGIVAPTRPRAERRRSHMSNGHRGTGRLPPVANRPMTGPPGERAVRGTVSRAARVRQQAARLASAAPGLAAVFLLWQTAVDVHKFILARDMSLLTITVGLC